MAEVKWSDEQLEIIRHRKGNLIVSAAAGSGKTAVLVERIFELITDDELGIDVDRLLVVTFTKDAAAQMREKLSDRIDAEIALRPDNKRLLRQQMLLRGASIVTIDSFCNSVVKEYFHDIDIDPAFRIGQEAELKLLQNNVLSDLIEECYKEHSEDFINMVESFFPTHTDEAIEELVLRLHGASEAQAWPIEWLSELRDEFILERDGHGGLKQGWDKYLTGYAHTMLSEIPERIDRAESLCEMDGGPKAYIPAIRSDRIQIEKLLGASSYEEYFKAFDALAFDRLSTKKEDRDPDVTERVKTIRNGYRATVKNLKDKYFSKDPQNIAAELSLAAGPVVTLIELTIRFSQLFGETKKERGILDFADIEHYALDILVTRNADGTLKRNRAAVELHERFKEIFVDEYQDSNFVQEQIIEAIAADADERPYTFMVGDVKQSIYKFRMAKPELFMNRYFRYRNEQTDGRAIVLGRNFRSRPEVLDATNDVFFLSMQEGVGGINYDTEAALVCGQKIINPTAMEPRKECRAEVILLSEDEEGRTDDLKADELRKIEARAAALRIKSLMNSGYIVGAGTDKEHPLRYGDIVVLLRTVKNWAETYREALEREGIPAFSDASEGFLKSYEITAMLNYLRILDNPRQDIPLAAVLHSPLVRISSDELVSIRTFAGIEIPMWEGLLSYAKDGPDEELRTRVRAFLADYEEIHSMNLSRDIDRVIERIYQKTGFYNYCTALPGGDRRASNLDMLLGYAAEYEASSFSGLFSFVRYIEQIMDSDQDLEEAVSSEAGNSVRIMSIHKSKGLEFPVVIVGGMAKSIGNMDGNQQIIVSSDFGIAAPAINLKLRTGMPTIRRDVLQLVMKLDNLGEEQRLLYVAMTRAKEKLIMIGATSKADKKLEEWSEMAERNPERYPVAYIAGQDSYMDLVYPAALMHSEDFDILTRNDIESSGAGAATAISDRRAGYEEFESAPYAGSQTDIARILDYEYPYGSNVVLPVKLTVSDIKRASMDHTEDVIREYAGEPKEQCAEEMMEETASGRAEQHASDRTKEHVQAGMPANERGTLYHKVMRFLPLELTSEDEVAEFIRSMFDRGMITELEYNTVKPRDIADFLRTDVAKRMLAAHRRGQLRREQPFVMARRACDIDPVGYAGITDIIPVQGVIDCMFFEDDRCVILDYKTDRVPKGHGDILVDRYHVQLENYAEAVSRITGVRVDETLIYSFALSEEITVWKNRR